MMTYKEIVAEARRLNVAHKTLISSANRVFPLGGGAVVYVYMSDEYGDLHACIVPRTSHRTDAQRLDATFMSGAQLAEYAKIVQAVELWKAGEGELPEEEVPHA